MNPLVLTGDLAIIKDREVFYDFFKNGTNYLLELIEPNVVILSKKVELTKILHETSVLVPAEKTVNNIVVICKKYYVRFLRI